MVVDVLQGHAMMVITYCNQTLYWRPKHYVLAGPPPKPGKSATATFISTGRGVSAANPACEVSNIAIVDGETLKPEENDHEALR